MVLFASDTKVLQYAKSVQSRFIRHGVDVFLHTSLSEVGLAKTSRGSHWIRPTHLSMVISATKADFLVVVGDRNMRNDTCQGRKSGKLVETPVVERISTILRTWASDHGVDASDIDGAAGGTSAASLEEKLQAYTGVPRASTRIDKIETETTLASRWRQPVRRPGSFVSAHDAEMATLVTNVQTQAIRLHRDLRAASEVLGALPVLPKVRFSRSGSSLMPRCCCLHACAPIFKCE